MSMVRLSVRRGLTLIELLVTVTVLSIAVALVIPSVGQTGVLRVQSAVRTIASDIAAAQTEAMAFQSRRAIYFGVVPVDAEGSAFVAGNGYVVVEPTGTSLTIDNLSQYMLYMPESPGKPYARVFDGGMRYGGAIIDDADFDGNPYLAFDELGGPLKSLSTGQPGAGGTITITAPDFGVAYAITVEAMTGRVDIDLIEGDSAADDDDDDAPTGPTLPPTGPPEETGDPIDKGGELPF